MYIEKINVAGAAIKAPTMQKQKKQSLIIEILKKAAARLFLFSLMLFILVKIGAVAICL